MSQRHNWLQVVKMLGLQLMLLLAVVLPTLISSWSSSAKWESLLRWWIKKVGLSFAVTFFVV